MSFASLGLAEPIVRAVTELGYTNPTPIQQQAIPAILAGGDLLAGAQTGTGKTAGFVLPILHQLTGATAPQRSASGRWPIRVLILTPTRELAAQVEESVRDYSRHLKITSLTVFGGVNINPQIKALQGRVDILVATPGRLLDHLQQRTVDLSGVHTLVLDEADRMLDMGFIRDIRKVLAVLPAKRQNLLFSATFSDEIKKLANDLLDNPKIIEVARRNAPAELVDQSVIQVDKPRKRELLSKLVLDNDWHQVLVFTRTKHGANRLTEQLGRDGISALAIHGNKSQSARTRALSEFKDGSLRVLVATDIAARGLDIEELPHVVNFELPNMPEDYVHRIGRTGRAGMSGEAISLVCVDELKFLADIEKLMKRQLPRRAVAGFEPDLSIKAVPIPMGRTARGQQYDDGLGESMAPRQMPRRQGGQGQRPNGKTAGGHGQGQRRAAGAGQPQRPANGQRPAQGQSNQNVAGQPQRSSNGQAPRASNSQPARHPNGAQRQANSGASRPAFDAPVNQQRSVQQDRGHENAQANPGKPATGNTSPGLGFRGTTRPGRFR
jgi:ATP-dependent RNA helicase RhlE